MLDPLLYVLIIAIALVLIALISVALFTGRLKRFGLHVSPKEGIGFDIETHEPKFEVEAGPVKMKDKQEPILPTTPQASGRRSDDPLPSLQYHDPPHPRSPQRESPSPILAEKLETKQDELEFWSDEYIVNLVARLRMDAEGEDWVKLIDHTLEGEG